MMPATSPRLRRLQSDLKAMQQLQSESSILHFTAHGDLPEAYTIWFLGRGLMRGENNGPIEIQERHEVHVRLGAGYPRMMPEIRWKSPIFHPNISGNGSVCLGGYGTYWVPSLTLDELCHMLWDMVRYENYDETSPYNREAALWTKTQAEHRLPLDARPLRDRLAGVAATTEKPAAKVSYPKSKSPVDLTSASLSSADSRNGNGNGNRWSFSPASTTAAPTMAPAAVRPAVPPVVRTPIRPTAPVRVAVAATTPVDDGVTFLDAEVVDAQVARPATSDNDILFIQ
jgi:ubiquitin-protein ligase